MKRALKWAFLLLATGFLALLALCWQSDLDPADLQAKYANGASQFIDVGGGLLVHARDQGRGEGPVLVLLHGSNASLQTWEPWVERLQSKYRIITLDQIGHGLTGPNPSDDYSPAAFVSVLDRTLAKLGVTHFALAGNSMGGAVAWNYALAHPEKVDALILIDAAGAPVAMPGQLPLGFRIARMPVIRRLAEGITPRPLVEKTVRQTIYKQSVIDDRMIDRYWELLLYPGNRRATALRFSTKRIAADTKAISRLHMPVLVMWGREDSLIPVAAARWFVKALPQAQQIVYPGVGHVPMEEAPDRSADDVDAFLSRLARPTQK
ncbi:MAG: alpha/beta hydrolase [Sphingomonadales bacterium]|nr:alpha/beta hydrolase [Sphingomonadales bacterium]